MAHKLISALLRLIWPKLDTPAILEYMHRGKAVVLENHLAPLVAFCERQKANENLTEAGFKHVMLIRKAIDALVEYDAITEELLTYYRNGLLAAQQLRAEMVPSLEASLGLPDPPTPPDERANDPIYRLGWARGYTLAQQRYEKVISLYATHAVISATPIPHAQPEQTTA